MSTQTTTQAFFDPKTWTVTYVVGNNATKRAAVIDAYSGERERSFRDDERRFRAS